jgi:hypothetical protein
MADGMLAETALVKGGGRDLLFHGNGHGVR